MTDTLSSYIKKKKHEQLLKLKIQILVVFMRGAHFNIHFSASFDFSKLDLSRLANMAAILTIFFSPAYLFIFLKLFLIL